MVLHSFIDFLICLRRRLAGGLIALTGAFVLFSPQVFANDMPNVSQYMSNNINASLSGMSQQQNTSSAVMQAKAKLPAASRPSSVNTYQQTTQPAYRKLLQNTAPLTPNQIRGLYSVFSGSKKAIAQPNTIPAKGTSNTIIVDISPGASAPVIRLGKGYVSAIRFLDATGQPWPIAAYDVGNQSLFNIHWNKKGNTIFVEATTDYQKSNIMVQLQGLSAPIMLNLVPGQSAIDYRDDLRINALGPNAVQVRNSTLPTVNDNKLSQVLNGVMPSGSRQLAASIAGVDVYEKKDRSALYVRMPSAMNLLSPAWTSVLKSDDGVTAYKIPLASTIVMIQRGKIQNFTVQGL